MEFIYKESYFKGSPNSPLFCARPDGRHKPDGFKPSSFQTQLSNLIKRHDQFYEDVQSPKGTEHGTPQSLPTFIQKA